MAEIIVNKLTAVPAGTVGSIKKFLVEYDITVRDFTFDEIRLRVSTNTQGDYYANHIIYDSSKQYHNEINIKGGGVADNLIATSYLATPQIIFRVLSTKEVKYLDSEVFELPIDFHKTPKTNKMKQKNFFQSALSKVAQFGKDGGFISFLKTGKFEISSDDSGTLVNIAVADAIDDEDAVTFKQLREKIAEMAKKGAVVIADLSTSPNPAQENEIRISEGLEFTRIVAGTPEVFIPADGTVISVAKELVIDAGLIKGNAEETVLKADHIYIYDAPTNQLFDNGSIGDAYDETHVSKKMPIVIDASGSATGIQAVPANAHVVGLEVIISEAFDGTPQGLKVQYAGANLLDFAALDLSEVAKMPVPTYAKETDATTPVITGAIDAGSKGKAVVLLEYVMA